MVDVFTILFSHAIILVAMWRLMQRDDLDFDDVGTPGPVRPWVKNQSGTPERASEVPGDA